MRFQASPVETRSPLPAPAHVPEDAYLDLGRGLAVTSTSFEARMWPSRWGIVRRNRQWLRANPPGHRSTRQSADSWFRYRSDPCPFRPDQAGVYTPATLRRRVL